MNTLHIFNPENDIALGNNLRHFTPPRNAMLLRKCGAMLMSWLADDGDIIYSDVAANDWLKNMGHVLRKDISILSSDNIGKVTDIKPWGWSNAIVGELCHMGLPSQLMPDDDRIARIRQLSHRHSSVIINRQLQEAGIESHIPLEFTDITELDSYLSHNRAVVIKSPWSSSGRGVIYSENTDRGQLLRLAAGMIKNQGCIMTEPMHDRLIDFAMLFESRENDIRYIGLSVFDTEHGGNYSGNIVASQQYLTSLLTKYIGKSRLDTLRANLETILFGLINGSYRGVCGVDMMVYRDADMNPHIAPCIELNLRTTMGYVAFCLNRSVMAHDAKGHMRIAYKGNQATDPCPPSHPCIDKDGRLYQGTMALVPANNYFDMTLTIDNDK